MILASFYTHSLLANNSKQFVIEKVDRYQTCKRIYFPFQKFSALDILNQNHNPLQNLIICCYDSAKVFRSKFSSFRIVNIWFIETLQKLIHSGIIQICACVALIVASAPHKTFHLIRSELM